MEKRIGIPEITKEFEILDIQKYNEEKPNGVKVITNEKNKYIDLVTSLAGHSVSIYDNASSFHLVKNFYLNGNIEIKGAHFNNGSDCGIFYEYNEVGELIAEINTDEGYDFGWVDVIKYCRKNDIELVKGYPERGGIKTDIYKDEEEGKKLWVIRYYNSKTTEYFELTLDGKTGKELRKRAIEFMGG